MSEAAWVTSRDGTKIAYEQVGAGPALMMIGGAFGVRGTAAGLAALMAPHFTTFAYDRRGRGESGDNQPYAVEREVEDLAALIRMTGGSAFVYGHSSGAILAIEGAAHGLPIARLALYEPPFFVDSGRAPMPPNFAAQLSALVAAGRRGDAVEAFWREAIQMPPEATANGQQAPFWPGLEALAHTLPYDQSISAPYQAGRPLPAEWARKITIPTLVLDGGASPAWIRASAAATASLLPHASGRTLPGQGHGARPEVLAPILAEFFGG